MFWTFYTQFLCVFFPADTVLSDESTTDLPSDPVKLLDVRDHIAMELLWTEQAIQSRKHVRDSLYLILGQEYYMPYLSNLARVSIGPFQQFFSGFH